MFQKRWHFQKALPKHEMNSTSSVSFALYYLASKADALFLCSGNKAAAFGGYVQSTDVYMKQTKTE